VRLLLDTHLLIWLAAEDQRLSPEAVTLIEDDRNVLVFSVVSLWEIAIKSGLERPGFRVHPRDFWQELLENGYEQLLITPEHAFAVLDLPRRHKDPFDRMLIAQARAERVTLLTADRRLAGYGPPVRLIT